MNAHLRLVHNAERFGESTVEIDGDDTIAELLRDLDRRDAKDDLTQRAIVCIRELVWQRDRAAASLQESARALNTAYGRLCVLRGRMRQTQNRL